MTLVALGSGELDGAGDEQFSIRLHNTCLQVSISLRITCTHEMSLEVARYNGLAALIKGGPMDV